MLMTRDLARPYEVFYKFDKGRRASCPNHNKLDAGEIVGSVCQPLPQNRRHPVRLLDGREVPGIIDDDQF